MKPVALSRITLIAALVPRGYLLATLASVLAAGAFVAERASALVAITNGNYFTGFIDVNFPSPGSNVPLKIERTYNSRSQYDGMFGYGWGTEFESFLITSADGSVVIQESGGGERTRFTPKDFNKKALDEYVKELVKEKSKKGAASLGNAQEYEQRLLKEAEFRDDEGRNLGIAPKLPVGSKLFSSERGDKQHVTVTKEGFVREFGDGKKAIFTLKAQVKDFGVDVRRRVVDVYKMTRFEDPLSGVTLNFRYNKSSGFLEELNDGRQQGFLFKMNAQGKVESVKDRQGRGATYKYCAATAFSAKDKCGPGDLTESSDAGSNAYKYEYDNVHNLTKIGYADGTAEEIAYWPPAPPARSGAKSVRTRKGVLMEYGYWENPKDPLHSKTDVKTTFRSGRISNAAYEYVRKRRADGSSFKYKMVTEIDGDKTDTIYNECCGQPLQVTDSSGITKYEYYADTGLPKIKDTPADTTTWEYSQKYRGKVTKVGVMTKGAQTKAVETVFDYNEKGNLKYAKTSDGRAVGLLYDNQGRIKTMVDQEKRKITFQYNDSSKPIEIAQEGVGAIVLVYDTKGNIKEVQPKGGKEIALTVTEAFQNLLEIIKPAGIQPI